MTGTGPRTASSIRFTLYVQIGGVSRLITAKDVIGSGDAGEPVITVKWPDDD